MKSRYRTWLAVPPEETEAVKNAVPPVKWPQSGSMGSREKNSGMPRRVPTFHC